MQVGINVQVLGSTVYLHVFERELALLVALQGQSIWKGVFFRFWKQLENNSLKLLLRPSAGVFQP